MQSVSGTFAQVYDFLDPLGPSEKSPAAEAARKANRENPTMDDVCLKELGLHYKGSLFISKIVPDQIMTHRVRQNRIRVIISMGFSISPWSRIQSQLGNPELVSYGLEDQETPEDVAAMKQSLPNIGKKIQECLLRGDNVLIHCYQGVSRSVTPVLYFISKMHDIPLLTAVKHVKAKRPVICPKKAFLELCL